MVYTVTWFSMLFSQIKYSSCISLYICYKSYILKINGQFHQYPLPLRGISCQISCKLLYHVRTGPFPTLKSCLPLPHNYLVNSVHLSMNYLIGLALRPITFYTPLQVLHKDQCLSDQLTEPALLAHIYSLIWWLLISSPKLLFWKCDWKGFHQQKCCTDGQKFSWYCLQPMYLSPASPLGCEVILIPIATLRCKCVHHWHLQ